MIFNCLIEHFVFLSVPDIVQIGEKMLQISKKSKNLLDEFILKYVTQLVNLKKIFWKKLSTTVNLV